MSNRNAWADSENAKGLKADPFSEFKIWDRSETQMNIDSTSLCGL